MPDKRDRNSDTDCIETTNVSIGNVGSKKGSDVAPELVKGSETSGSLLSPA